MNNNPEMTFLEHFSELRFRIFKIFFSVISFSVVSYIFSDLIIEYLIKPIDDPHINVQVLKLTTIFTTKLMVSFFSGLIFSLPIILYQILFFIKPAFSNSFTLRKLVFFIIFSISLCILGLLFGYSVLIPLSVNFFKNISFNLLDIVKINLTLDAYLSYFIWILIISSFIYQLPIFILLLVKATIIDIAWLKSNRRYVIVSFFIVAALFSPPDPVSQILVAIPLIFLYELSIIISRVLYSE